MMEEGRRHHYHNHQRLQENNKKPRDHQQQQQQRQQGRGSESALYEVLCPAVYVLRVFGLAPYAYPKDNRPPRLRASNFNCIYTLVWIGIYSYIVVTSFFRFEGVNRNKPVLRVTENGKLILNYLVSLSDLVMGVLRRQQFAHVWNSIEDFDETFELGSPTSSCVPLGTYNSYYSPTRTTTMHRHYKPLIRRTRFWLWVAMVVSFFGWLLINQLGMAAFNEPYIFNVSYMITYVGSFVAVFKFSGVVLLLGQRFAHLTELVHKQCLLQHRARIESVDFMKKIETSYDLLLSTSDQLNDLYSWSLFLFLFNLFCHVVSNMYFFTIWTVVDPTYLENPKVVFCEFSWLLIYLMQLFLLHSACHFASFEANRMALGLLDWRRNAYRQNRQSGFSSTLHLLNRKLNFTAAGCFNVNLPLLTSTFGYITTYLVILLQLPDNSNS